ncbi:MAG TPA: HAMP domain-containing protein [Chloroflexi bacterium]|nr:HAMP domain-containing protein [Chloroflexota bacterium]
MRSLYWKGMLAFLAVILVAVGTVAVLAGRATEVEFRRYAFVHGGMLTPQVEALSAYYAEHGSWEGVEALFSPPHGGQGMGRRGRGGGSPWMAFRLVDADGQVVVDPEGRAGGAVSPAELGEGVPIEVDGTVVGYLLPAGGMWDDVLLEPPQVEFLSRVRTTLWIAALMAMGAALLVGGLLFRSIIGPLRRLTVASQAIAAGDLSARAPVRGRDEVAQLAAAFNQMAESLERAEEARRHQTADIAHELRTPLTVIQGTLEAMVDGVYPANRENLLAALAQVRTLVRLVEDLRILALADAGQLRLHRAPLDLRPLLEEVVEAHRPQARERGIALDLEAPPALPLVLADRDRLAQVMGNLLSNAVRYVPEGGHVSVRVEDRGREVAVAVVDDGPGVAEEDLERLFDRFWRGDPARRRATGGSGLGLAIARHIVEAHSGRIWAEPTPGGGLTVIFTLPAAEIAEGRRR